MLSKFLLSIIKLGCSSPNIPLDLSYDKLPNNPVIILTEKSAGTDPDFALNGPEINYYGDGTVISRNAVSL